MRNKGVKTAYNYLKKISALEYNNFCVLLRVFWHILLICICFEFDTVSHLISFLMCGSYRVCITFESHCDLCI